MVGRVRRAHGLRGELVIESVTDAPDAVFAPGRRVFAGTKTGKLSPGASEMRITHSAPFKGGWIVGFDTIVDKTQADQWRERCLMLPENEIEPPAEGEVFIHDLVGMSVVHVDGSQIGDVVQVMEMPQGLMLEVRRAKGPTALLPFDDHTVAEVDTDARIIRVDPVEGLLD